jgi:hypothetical protein
MVAITIKNYKQKILIIGPIYDQLSVVTENKNILEQYPLIIFNGNLCYPNHDLNAIAKRIEAIDQYLKPNKGIYNLGNQDLLLMKRLFSDRNANDILQWLESKSNVVMIDFDTQSRIIITGGGLTPEMSLNDLRDNIETSFVSQVGDKPWHQWYGGAYGYIVSNNPLTQAYPQFYNYSVQIGNSYQEKTPVYAIQAGRHGIGRVFSL